MKFAVAVTILMCVMVVDALPMDIEELMSLMNKPAKSKCPKKTPPTTPPKTPDTTPPKTPDTTPPKTPDTTPPKTPDTDPPKTPDTKLPKPAGGKKTAGALANTDGDGGEAAAVSSVDDDKAISAAIVKGKGSALAFSSS